MTDNRRSLYDAVCMICTCRPIWARNDVNICHFCCECFPWRRQSKDAGPFFSNGRDLRLARDDLDAGGSNRDTQLNFRSFNPRTDFDRVMELVNHDRAPAMPECRPQGLRNAVAGNVPTDNHLWQQLTDLQTTVAEVDHEIASVVSSARLNDGSGGELLWLHAQERSELIRPCIDHVLDRLSMPQVRAFNLSSALAPGLEGLPIQRRAATMQVLEEAGFKPYARWTTLSKFIDATALMQLQLFATIIYGGAPSWTISVEQNGQELGYLEASLFETTGVILYFFVDEAARRRGVGRSLLLAAEYLLASHGASALILQIDHGYVGENRNRAAATAFCLALGFVMSETSQSFSLAG